jgi:hypothetical protein
MGFPEQVQAVYRLSRPEIDKLWERQQLNSRTQTTDNVQSTFARPPRLVGQQHRRFPTSF